MGPLNCVWRRLYFLVMALVFGAATCFAVGDAMVTSYYSLVAPGAVFGFFTYVMIWSALFHGGYEMEKGFVIGQQVLDDHIKVDQGRPVYSAKARYYLLLADAKKPGKTCWVKVTSTEYFQVQGVLAIMGRYYYDPDDDRRFIDQQQS